MQSEKLKIRQAVIVEGKYDKIRLEPIIDALILPTDGFKIFKDIEMKNFIRNLASQRGIVILTDSDVAGFKIRSYLAGMIPREQITNVYIPDIMGKEKRKRAPSAEGKLGVEGIETEVLRRAFELAGITSSTSERVSDPITRLDLYEDGIIGGQNSRAMRLALYEKLSLPSRINLTAALPLINVLLTRAEYKAWITSISNNPV